MTYHHLNPFKKAARYYYIHTLLAVIKRGDRVSIAKTHRSDKIKKLRMDDKKYQVKNTHELKLKPGVSLLRTKAAK